MLGGAVLSKGPRPSLWGIDLCHPDDVLSRDPFLNANGPRLTTRRGDECGWIPFYYVTA